MAKKFPKISIVTPSFNQGHYIEDTIRSVLSQAGDFHIEHIIMDGGSTDESVEIIRKYDRLLEDGNWPLRCKGIQFRWTSQKDSGQSDAINKGLKMSHGGIVAYLNSDDMYLEGTMQRAVEYFDENKGADIIYGDCRVVDAGGKIIDVWQSREFDLLSELCLNFIYQPTVFMRRRVLEQVGNFDEAFHYCMDIDYWYRAGGRVEFAYVPVEMAAFRITGDSKTGKSKIPFTRERKRALERFFDEYADDALRCWRNRVFAWHHFYAGRELYSMTEFVPARQEFVKAMRLEPVSLKTLLSLLSIVDCYCHTRFFPKAVSVLQPRIPETRRKSL